MKNNNVKKSFTKNFKEKVNKNKEGSLRPKIHKLPLEEENKEELTEKKILPSSNIKNINEIKIYGVNACFAAFKARFHEIVRVYVETNKVKSFSKILKFCAEKK